eukprot:5300512-Prorocentrum_lima.AAC.1
MTSSLVGSEMCIRDRVVGVVGPGSWVSGFAWGKQSGLGCVGLLLLWWVLLWCVLGGCCGAA